MIAILSNRLRLEKWVVIILAFSNSFHESLRKIMQSLHELLNILVATLLILANSLHHNFHRQPRSNLFPRFYNPEPSQVLVLKEIIILHVKDELDNWNTPCLRKHIPNFILLSVCIIGGTNQCIFRNIWKMSSKF